MRKLLHIIAILIALPVLSAVAGCTDSDGEPTTQVRQYDIVCLAGVSREGSEYTLTKPSSGKLVVYRSREIFDTTHVKLGDRFMLAYIAPSGVPYTSGIIKPIGYSPITNDTLQWGYIDKVEDWDRDPVYLLSSWLSQDYLNLRARLPYDTEPRLLAVMIDSLTLDNPYPDCYLVHRLEKPVETFDRNYYMSFDMSALRKLDNCRGFNLILNNSNLKVDQFKFDLLNNEL